MELVWGTNLVKYRGFTEIGSIFLDASIDEGHSMTAQATSHPVETGSNISDHVHTDPRMVRIDGLITNHPIDLPGSHAAGVQIADKEFEWTEQPSIGGVQLGGPGVIGGIVGGVVSAVGADVHKGSAKGFEPSFDRVQDVWKEFEAIHNEGRVVDIVTTLHVYHNMVIESLDVQRNAASGNSLPFVATAKQILIVETGVVPSPVKPTVERGKPENTRGKQSSPETEPAATRSVLDKLLF